MNDKQCEATRTLAGRTYRCSRVNYAGQEANAHAHHRYIRHVEGARVTVGWEDGASYEYAPDGKRTHRYLLPRPEAVL